MGIDDQGRVVGVFEQDGVVPKAFLYQNGQIMPLPLPSPFPDDRSIAIGISEGRIVGSFDDNSTHGFLYDNGQVTQLDYPGAEATVAYGINAAGRIVGRAGAQNNPRRHGFIYENGQYQAINFPQAGAITELYDCSENAILGAVTGTCVTQPFLLTRDRFVLIDLPGTRIFGINDAGQIVGDSNDERGLIARVGAFTVKRNRNNSSGFSVLDPFRNS